MLAILLVLTLGKINPPEPHYEAPPPIVIPIQMIEGADLWIDWPPAIERNLPEYMKIYIC